MSKDDCKCYPGQGCLCCEKYDLDLNSALKRENRRLSEAVGRCKALLVNGASGGEITREYCKQMLDLINKDDAPRKQD